MLKIIQALDLHHEIHDERKNIPIDDNIGDAEKALIASEIPAQYPKIYP